MIILVINCGSSSIKYQLLDMKSDDVFDVIAKGIAEKIGLPAGILQYAPTGKDKIVTDVPIPDHKEGMKLILKALTDPQTGVLSSLEDIEAVGHRIVQGGDFFSGSVLVNQDV
ncbi:MAG: acetate kinase, partial [Bacteroidales bacterium]|nr:acetate kinase [Bacteroidales bacterium]